MNIIIKDIPEEGLHLHFKSPQEGWFKKVLAEAMEDIHHPTDLAEASFKFYRVGDHVDCSGRVRCQSHPTCCRCLKEFALSLSVPIHLTLAPLYENEHELKLRGEEDVELVKEDMEFAFYEGAEFNLGDLIREQVILVLPMQPLCDPDCKGLCQQCGQNLNEVRCSCGPSQAKTKIDFPKGVL